jgi:LacI family gluconate utilization system Gnt-I transcriptional repressor
MTRYLIAKGYRRIAMVGGAFENNDQASDRRDGFLEAMRQAGLSIRSDFIIEVPNPTTIESGAEAMKDLLDDASPPDAVFFQAELPAHGALMACLSRGISVPGQVAIAGFGDMKLSRILPVPLTTVQVPGKAIGAKAAQVIIDRLNEDHGEGKDPEAPSAPLIFDMGYAIKIRQSA